MNQDAKSQDTLPFLLEIGSEEIPARFIPGAMDELRARTEALLGAARLSWRRIEVLATPRRLALTIEGLSSRQPDQELEIKGPPVSVAFAADGSPTPAAVGFARKAGVELADCRRDGDGRGGFLMARKVEAGRPAAAVLTDELPAAILGLPFRKTMRWGDHELEYPRPLQWIAALLGDQVVPLRVGYLAADRLTRGHRTLARDRAVAIPAADAYREVLREVGVIVDPAERRELIETGLARALVAYDPAARLLADEELMTEVVFLCEHPTPFLGGYGEDYFALPAEVITTALKAHQRYFSVARADGKTLLPRFAAVRDGGGDHLANVIAGNERVLRARLADALFYWEFDQKQTPDQRTAQLGTVTWLEGFGSVLDKTRRLADLAGWLWTHGLGGTDPVPADLTRAAAICKSDLVSEMIKDGKEFTKLEGFIGARYAGRAGESETVCRAIERHYQPRSATGELPDDPVSAALAVADRLDNIAGCWLAGFQPTGAKDPYALRRQVLAVLRILLDRELPLDLEQALARALGPVAALAPGREAATVAAELAEFVRTRLFGHFTEALGTDAQVTRAVLPVRWRQPVDALRWVRALEGYREKEGFQLLATGFKRCRNILKGAILPVSELDACLARWRAGGRGSAGEDLGALPEPAERRLLREVAAAATDLATAEAGGDYARVFALLTDLGPAIDGFFEAVRVNVEDEALTALRHAFLREVHGIFASYADFGEVAPAD